MRAKKNDVVGWLDNMYQNEREKIVNWSIRRARNKRTTHRKREGEIAVEISRRAANKRQKKSEKCRKEVEKKVKAMDPSNIKKFFPDLSDDIYSGLTAILTGKVVGRTISHTWFDADSGCQSVWSGKVEKMKKSKGQVIYRIAYWDDKEESYEDSTDFDISHSHLLLIYF